MVYITGDCHGEFHKLSNKNFPQSKNLTREDYVIICGDFGNVWDLIPSSTEKYWYNWLCEKPYTILFIDGNHENFDRLNNDYPEIDFLGGRAHKISNNIYHLIRGYVFEIEGKKFFTFGGACSHDIKDGILHIEDFNSYKEMINIYKKMKKANKFVRIENETWWAAEQASTTEMLRGLSNLEKVNYKVDFIITHCAPQSMLNWRYFGAMKPETMTLYFDTILKKAQFHRWYCGHYHIDEYFIKSKDGKDCDIPTNFSFIYNNIVRII